MNAECLDAQSCVSQETDVQSVQTMSTVVASGGDSMPGNGPCKCGLLEIALLYDAPMRKMTVHVLQARNILPNKDKPAQLIHTQVRYNPKVFLHLTGTSFVSRNHEIPAFTKNLKEHRDYIQSNPAPNCPSDSANEMLNKGIVLRII